MHTRLTEALARILGFAPPLPHYGALLSLSLLLGIVLANRALRQRGFTSERRSSILLWSVTGALVGAKLLYLVQFPSSVAQTALAEAVRSGFSLYGGLFGLSAGVLLSARRQSLVVLDRMTPAFALGLTLTRLGCFLQGCCYGRLTNLPWGVRFPRESPAWTEQVREGLLAVDAPLTHPVHPTELYEAALGLVLFGLGVAMGGRDDMRPGRVFFTVVSVYTLFRAFEETLRADAGGLAFGPLTFSQGISVVLFGATAVLTLRR